MQYYQTFYTNPSESSQQSQRHYKMLPTFPEFYQDPQTTMGKSLALESFFSHKPSDLDLTAVTKLPVPAQERLTADKLPFNFDVNDLVQPYYSFVEMLNKKEGLITELPSVDQFEDFLHTDALDYDGIKLRKVERFPKYYRLVADTSGAGEKCKQPKKQMLVCKF